MAFFRAAGLIFIYAHGRSECDTKFIWFSGKLYLQPLLRPCTRQFSSSHRRNHCIMLRGRKSWQLPWLIVVVFLMLVAHRVGAQKEPTGGSVDVARMSILEIEDALQVCIHP